MALNFRKAGRLRNFFNGCEITMETFEQELCVCGYHVYQRIWTAAVGEVLHCEREPTNSQDRYAVAVKIFVRKIFVSPDIYENIVTTKISRSTVVHKLKLSVIPLCSNSQSFCHRRHVYSHVLCLCACADSCE